MLCRRNRVTYTNHSERYALFWTICHSQLAIFIDLRRFFAVWFAIWLSNSLIVVTGCIIAALAHWRQTPHGMRVLRRGEESLRFSKATDSAASLAGTVKVKRSCQLENSARLFGDTGRGDEYCDSFYNKPKNEGVNAS